MIMSIEVRVCSLCDKRRKSDGPFVDVVSKQHEVLEMGILSFVV
jgi:hypothetical protein